jgi:hypothetical protein
MAMVGACRKVVVPSRRTLEHVDFEPQHLFFLRWIGGWIRSQLHLLALQNIYGSIPEAADFTALEDDANGSKLQMGWKTSTKLQMYEHTQPEIRY